MKIDYKNYLFKSKSDSQLIRYDLIEKNYLQEYFLESK